MIIKKILGVFACVDYNFDELSIIEGVAFDTRIVDIQSINGTWETHIILNKEKAREVGNLLVKWADEKPEEKILEKV